MENNTNSSYGGLRTNLYNDKESAERAFQSLRDRGYSQAEINLIMSDETRKKHFEHSDHDSELGNKALEGAGAGSAIGGTAGAIIGAIAAIGTSVALPGLGLLVAGPLVAGLAGAGAGGLTGGLVGALIGSGIPEDRAKEYEQGVKNGGIVLGVNPRNQEDADYLDREWNTHHHTNV